MKCSVHVLVCVCSEALHRVRRPRVRVAIVDRVRRPRVRVAIVDFCQDIMTWDLPGWCRVECFAFLHFQCMLCSNCHGEARQADGWYCCMSLGIITY